MSNLSLHPPRAGLPHSPALDGLRGVAVLAVVAYHYVERAVPGGFLGVDLFFVLSGYLITSLLLEELAASGRIGLAAFWARRARRLLPAALVLVVVTVLGAVVLVPGRFPSLADDALASIAYVANWRFIVADQSYFAEFEVASPLRHAWSLSIEEQFYVLWPVFVSGVVRAKGGGTRALFVLAALGMVGSAVACAALYEDRGASRAHLGTDARAHEILAGALLALAERGRVGDRIRSWSPTLAPLAVVCIFASFVVLADESALYFRGFSIAFSFGCAVVIAAVRAAPDSRLARALAFSPLARIGRISYAIYLWHWPIRVAFESARLDLERGALVVLETVATFVLAGASYVAIERPIRRSAMGGRATAFWAIAATATAVAIVLVADRHRPPREGAPPSVAMGFAGPDVDRLPAVDPAAKLRVALAGDSVAASLHRGLDAYARERRWQLADVTFLGCGVTGVRSPRPTQLGGCGDEAISRQRRMVEIFEPDLVIVQSRYELQDFFEPSGVFRMAGTPEHRARVRTLYAELIARLSTRGATVVFVDPLPSTASFCPPDATSTRCAIYAGWESRIDEYAAILDDAGRGFPGRYVRISLRDRFCSGTTCPDVVDGHLLRPDGNHFSQAGGLWTVPIIARRAQAAGARVISDRR